VRLAIVANVGSTVIDIANAGDGSGRLFFVRRTGGARVRERALLGTPFQRAAYPPDRAMSSLAFHPEYATNGKLYLITGEATPNPFPKDFVPPQVDSDTPYDNVLVEYLVSGANPDQVNAASRRELLRIHQPNQDMDVNDLAFARNGAAWNLLIAAGDGGHTRSGSPTHYETNAQLTTNPYGKFLRIDVDQIGPNGKYAIPPDNPFASGAGGTVREIFAWGVRNPWRIAVDRLTGESTRASTATSRSSGSARERNRNYGWWCVRAASGIRSGNASVDRSRIPRSRCRSRSGTTTARRRRGSVISGPVYRGQRRACPTCTGSCCCSTGSRGDAGDEHRDRRARARRDRSAGALLQAFTDITFGEDELGEAYIGGLDGRVRPRRAFCAATSRRTTIFRGRRRARARAPERRRAQRGGAGALSGGRAGGGVRPARRGADPARGARAPARRRARMRRRCALTRRLRRPAYTMSAGGTTPWPGTSRPMPTFNATSTGWTPSCATSSSRSTSWCAIRTT
jgi:hypothetical protein